MAGTVQDLDRVVEAQVGYVESGGKDGRSGNITKFGKAYGLDGYAWCSMFIWWCFAQIGIDLRKDVSGSYASAEAAMEGFAKRGWRIVKAPRLMDVVFFHFDGEAAGADHTGFVVAADAGGVHTIEGNTSAGVTGSQSNGGGVYRRYRPYSCIIGYGRYPLTVAAQSASAPKPVSLPRVTPVVGRTFPVLRYGNEGPQVTRLQQLLHVTADGDFGPKTERALIAFQKRKHLVPDGVAGPASLRALGY